MCDYQSHQRVESVEFQSYPVIRNELRNYGYPHSAYLIWSGERRSCELSFPTTLIDRNGQIQRRSEGNDGIGSLLWLRSSPLTIHYITISSSQCIARIIAGYYILIFWTIYISYIYRYNIYIKIRYSYQCIQSFAIFYLKYLWNTSQVTDWGPGAGPTGSVAALRSSVGWVHPQLVGKNWLKYGLPPYFKETSMWFVFPIFLKYVWNMVPPKIIQVMDNWITMI